MPALTREDIRFLNAAIETAVRSLGYRLVRDPNALAHAIAPHAAQYALQQDPNNPRRACSLARELVRTALLLVDQLPELAPSQPQQYN